MINAKLPTICPSAGKIRKAQKDHKFMFHQCADSAAVQVAEDGLFDYEVRCTVASGEPLKGLELPALGHRDQAPATGPALSSDRKEATGPSSLREAGNNCCSI